MKKIIFIFTILLITSSLIFSQQTQLGGSVKLRGNTKVGSGSTSGGGGVGLLQAGDTVFSVGLTSNVRDGGSITANIIGTSPQTIQGTVSSCVNDTSGSWRRWCNIDFSSGTDGWVTEDRLRRVTDSQGAKSILQIRAVYPDHSGDANPSNAQLNAWATTANNVFSATSYGQLSSITTTIAPTSGSFTLPNNYSHYSALFGSGGAEQMCSEILNHIHTIATAAGFDWTTYFHNVVWLPQDYGVGFASCRLFRGSVVLTTFQNNDYSIIPAIHDRIGIADRANAWNSNDNTVFGSAGSSTPNGDPFDIFGTENTTVGYSLYHKNLGAKWIPNANVHQVTSNGTYRIYAIDTETTITTGRFYGIRMPAYINSGFCSTCTEYFIEYREDQGLLVNWGGKDLLDMVPTTETFGDAFLTVALSPFTDPSGHTISVSAASGTTPKFVDVIIGGL